MKLSRNLFPGLVFIRRAGTSQRRRGMKKMLKEGAGYAGIPAAATLALALLKLLGAIRCGWLVVAAPLAGMALGGVLIAMVNILWAIWM